MSRSGGSPRGVWPTWPIRPTRQTFRRLARDPDWGIRNEAARGLAWSGAADGRDALLTLARDVEPVVARTARQSLDQLAGRSEPARQVRRTA